MTCSKLSSASSSRRGRRYDSRSVISWPAEVFRPSPAAIAGATRSAAETEASSRNRAPSAKPGPSRRAASTMSRLFPTPPGPVRVTSRTPSPTTRSSTAAISCSRPSSGVGRHRNSPGQRRLVRGVLAGVGQLEPLAQQHRQVVLDQLLQLGGVREVLVGDVTLVLDPGQHLRQPRIAIRRRRLDVDEPGQPGRQPVLVLQPGHLLAGRDPAVALPVDRRRRPGSAPGRPGTPSAAGAAGRPARTSPAPAAAGSPRPAPPGAQRPAPAAWNSRRPGPADRACG